MIGCRAHDYGRGTAKEMAQKLRADGWECGQIVIQKLINSYSALDEVTAGACEEVYREFTDLGLKTPLLGYYIQPQLMDRDARREQVELFKKGLDNSLALGGAYVGLIGQLKIQKPCGEGDGVAQCQQRQRHFFSFFYVLRHIYRLSFRWIIIFL